MPGYAMLAILNPQPDEIWDGHESLCKQFKISIENIETKRKFVDVNKIIYHYHY